mgnify:CR=1 FL=1
METLFLKSEHIKFCRSLNIENDINELGFDMTSRFKNSSGKLNELREIKPLDEFDGKYFDAIIFVGGFGAAKNLSTVAFDGSDAIINADVESSVTQMLELKKPIGALCISPAFITKIIGDVNVTIGKDTGTAEAIEAMGGTHIITSHGDVVVDEEKLVFTTPCYMLEANIMDIDDGATNIVKSMMEKIN